MEQRVLWDKATAEYTEKLKAEGVEFINIDNRPFFEATAPVREKYGAQFAGLMKRLEAVK
jgi:TRAP-type C4-dicarboxylate transport system substrate-binding protein